MVIVEVFTLPGFAFIHLAKSSEKSTGCDPSLFIKLSGTLITHGRVNAVMAPHSGVNVVVKGKARLGWGEWDGASVSAIDIHHSPCRKFLANFNDKQMCC